jgi:transposase
MEQVTTIGLDIAKNVFQLHGVDAAGNVLLRKQLRRGDVLRFFSGLSPCLVGMEACATAHYWARELAKLGHTVRLMPPAYVKPYVKRGKTDAADAEAIAEAVTRPTMRFVAVKTAEQQAVLMLHKVRDLLVRQRTMLINALRGHLVEFGIIAARGPGGVTAAIVALHEMQDSMPVLARVALHGLVDQLRIVRDEVVKVEKRIVAQHRANDASRRLATIPGIGPITASAIAAAVPDATLFQIRPPVRGLARPDATNAQQRRQGATRRHHQAGRRLYPTPPGHRCDRGDPACTPRQCQQVLGCQAARSENRPGWYRWRLPTRPRGSPGRCSPAINPTWLRPCSRSPARPSPVKR